MSLCALVHPTRMDPKPISRSKPPSFYVPLPQQYSLCGALRAIIKVWWYITASKPFEPQMAPNRLPETPISIPTGTVPISRPWPSLRPFQIRLRFARSLFSVGSKTRIPPGLQRLSAVSLLTRLPFAGPQLPLAWTARRADAAAKMTCHLPQLTTLISRTVPIFNSHPSGDHG